MFRKRAAREHTACLLAQPHQNHNYITEPPSLRTVRNRVEWKSDNYGIKEPTSIQTGRRGRDVEWAGPSGGISQEQRVPVPHKAPQPRVPVPGR